MVTATSTAVTPAGTWQSSRCPAAASTHAVSLTLTSSGETSKPDAGLTSRVSGRLALQVASELQRGEAREDAAGKLTCRSIARVSTVAVLMQAPPASGGRAGAGGIRWQKRGGDWR